MYARERSHHARDNDRMVRPFEWGLSCLIDHVNGDDPRDVLQRYADAAMQSSDDFYRLPLINDFRLNGEYLTWTSAVNSSSPENNLVKARYFPAKSPRKDKPRAAVLVLPQWNAKPASHVEACRIFNFLGI